MPQTANGIRASVLCCSWGGWVWGLQACATPKALVVVCLHHLLLSTTLQDATLSTVWRNCHSWGCSFWASSYQQHIRPAHTLEQVPGEFQLVCGSLNLFHFIQIYLLKVPFYSLSTFQLPSKRLSHQNCVYASCLSHLVHHNLFHITTLTNTARITQSMEFITL